MRIEFLCLSSREIWFILKGLGHGILGNSIYFR